MRPVSSCRASSVSSGAHAPPVGSGAGAGAAGCGRICGSGAGSCTVTTRSTTRSTTSTAARPDSAARCCSHARCRHEVPHHFGTRPFAGTATSAPHQLHVTAAGRTVLARPTPVVATAAAPVAALPVVIFYARSLVVTQPLRLVGRALFCRSLLQTYRVNDYNNTTSQATHLLLSGMFIPL